MRAASLATLAALLLSLPLAAHASGEIVYAAQYYNPPAKFKTRSYSHLYRINPDGTGRRQLTFSKADDLDPRWSPDGRYIAFVRYESDKPSVYRISATGKGTPHLIARGAGTVEWDEDSRSVVIVTLDSKTVRIDAVTGKQLRASSGDFEDGPNTLQVERDGSLRLKLPKSASPSEAYLRLNLDAGAKHAISEDISDMGSGEKLYPDLDTYPVLPHHLLMGIIRGTSTDMHWFHWLLVNTQTGKTTDWGDANSPISWSPNGKQFVTYLGRDLAPYGSKPHDGRIPYVWVRSLLIGSTTIPTKLRPIVKGLVYIQGSDWRHGKS